MPEILHRNFQSWPFTTECVACKFEELERANQIITTAFNEAVDALAAYFDHPVRQGRYSNLLKVGDSITRDGPSALVEFLESEIIGLHAHLQAIQEETARTNEPMPYKMRMIATIAQNARRLHPAVEEPGRPRQTVDLDTTSSNLVRGANLPPALVDA